MGRGIHKVLLGLVLCEGNGPGSFMAAHAALNFRSHVLAAWQGAPYIGCVGLRCLWLYWRAVADMFVKRLIRFRIFLFFVLACNGLSVIDSPARADGSRVLRTLNTPGHFALIRHALAPGTGDPAGLAIGDCSTQRNLSGRGRQQAIRIGKALRHNGLVGAIVFTSQWCRCRQTANLLKLGPVKDLPVLNSFFQQQEKGKAQTQGLQRWLLARDLSKPVILVTHQVNITELTGVFPDSGEIVVARFDSTGQLKVVGTVAMD
jgi:8-oxo-(d)GTP phosphatase